MPRPPGLTWISPASSSSGDLRSTTRCRRSPGVAAQRPRDTRPDSLAVGGNFLERVLEPIGACALFERIDYYNYYDNWRSEWPEQRISRVDRVAIKWQEELRRPTVVLLELNESS